MSTMRNYRGHVQFKAVGIVVKARNAAEAKRKIKLRLMRKPASSLIDHENTFIDAED